MHIAHLLFHLDVEAVAFGPVLKLLTPTQPLLTPAQRAHTLDALFDSCWACAHPLPAHACRRRMHLCDRCLGLRTWTHN